MGEIISERKETQWRKKSGKLYEWNYLCVTMRYLFTQRITKSYVDGYFLSAEWTDYYIYFPSFLRFFFVFSKQKSRYKNVRLCLRFIIVDFLKIFIIGNKVKANVIKQFYGETTCFNGEAVMSVDNRWGGGESSPGNSKAFPEN